jgi:hypothetical protein
MLLILEPHEQRGTRSPLEGREFYQRMLDFTASLRKRDLLIASDSLKRQAVRFAKHDGTARLLDGPFTESKELIGGFFLLDCKTQEEALLLAKECPAAEWATIEVREVGPCYD